MSRHSHRSGRPTAHGTPRAHTRGWVGFWLPYAGIWGLALFFSVHVNGCSIAGALIGAGIDAGNLDKPRLVPTHELARFKPGDMLVLHLRDSTQVGGRYVGPVRFTHEDYRVRYEAWRDSSPAAADLPALGQAVQVHIGRRTPSAGRGELAAFTHNGVEIGRGLNLLHYSRISALEVIGGVEIPGQRLLDLRLAGHLPVVTAISMETEGGEQAIPLDDVVLVTGPTHTNVQHALFAVGLIVDALVVVGLATARSEDTNTASCTPSPQAAYRASFLGANVFRPHPRGRDDSYVAQVGETVLTP